MSMLDGILGQLSNNPTVENLAAKVGLSPEQVEQAVAALGQAHTAPGDTVATAAGQTGLPTDKLLRQPQDSPAGKTLGGH